jgi:hypothetical protein
MKKTRQLVTIGLLATGLVALYGCSSDAMQEEDGGNNNGNIQPVELKIQTSVEMARTATEGVVKGDAFADGDTIAVYAHSEHYNNTSNNYALYQLSGSSWAAMGTTNKIYLSTEDATIYGVYPPKLEVTHNSAISESTTAAIAGLFTGKADSADDGNKITISSASSTDAINAAKGEKDCMWATASSVNATSSTATLAMAHALALVSFKFYKDNTFQGTGSLTKIELTKADTSGEFKTGAATMNISNGTISTTGNDQGTLTRFPYTDTTPGYTLTTNSSDLPGFSFMVYPNTSLADNKVKAIFTIDGVAYPINIPAVTSNSNEWKAAYNTIYTVKMTGKEPTLSVSVTKWQDATVSSDLTPIN